MGSRVPHSVISTKHTSITFVFSFVFVKCRSPHVSTETSQKSRYPHSWGTAVDARMPSRVEPSSQGER